MKLVSKIQFNYLLLILLSSSFVYAQTGLSGLIPFDTTLTSDLSPYSVVGDVQVPDGVILTIEPGVEIQYAGAYEILVRGSIIANGTENDTIIFTSSVPGVSSDATQLRFNGSALENSQLSYLKMEHAARSIQVGEETEHDQGGKNTGTLSVTNISIHEADVITDGYETGAVVVLSDAKISSSTIRGTYPRSEEITIENSEITNCTISSDSYNEGLTLKNCTVTNSHFVIGCCGANIQVISSTITESDIQEGDGNPVTGPLKISDCEAVNTFVNLPAARVEVKSSTLNYSGATGLIFGNGLIDRTQVSGDSSGIAVRITGFSGYNVGGNVSITNSTISQNSVAIQISDANVLSIQNNNILENSTYNIENLSDKEISATHNWWGTLDAAEINSKIWDYNDDIKNGEVIFSPFLMSPIDTTVTSIWKNIFVPKENTLSQNYPNPFNPETKITYKLKEDSYVELKVYDISGREIQTLVNRQQSPGEYSVSFNAFDLASGIYIYKLKAGAFEQNHKMVLLR